MNRDFSPLRHQRDMCSILNPGNPEHPMKDMNQLFQ
jgi:hypothetical protein